MDQKDKEFVAALREAGLTEDHMLFVIANDFVRGKVLQEIQLVIKVIASMLTEMKKEHPEKGLADLLSEIKDDLSTGLRYMLERDKILRLEHRKKTLAMLD